MEVVLSRTDSDVHTLSGNTGASVRPGEKIAFLYRLITLRLFCCSLSESRLLQRCSWLGARLARGAMRRTVWAPTTHRRASQIRKVRTKLQRLTDLQLYHTASHLLASHDLEALLDEGMADEEVADLENAEVICKRFLALDFSNDREEFKDVIGIKTAIAEVLGRVSVS